MVRDVTLDALPSLPVKECLDTLPSVGELRKAIGCLSCGKVPGNDGILTEVLKNGNLALLQHLHELLCVWWERGHVLQDMHDTKIVTLYKKKRDRSDCKKYRGISFLSVVGEVFARVVLIRLQSLVSRV